MGARYDDVAEWYDGVVRRGLMVHDAALRSLHDLAGDVSNLRICDLACGQGVAARAFAARGAHVVGVDISRRLLEIARAEELAQPRGVAFLEMDAQALAGLASCVFDGVACNLALMDIDDLDAAARAVFRVLRPGGWFICAVLHPCFHGPSSEWVAGEADPGRTVRGYFDEGRWNASTDGMRSRVGMFHRTLSSYVNTLSRVGFVLEAVREPSMAREPGAIEPAYDVVPAVLAARFSKA